MDLTQLTPEELAHLKGQLDGLTDMSGRSPMRPRQLHDLRLLPSATDPRPLFIPSAEQPRDYQPGPARYYPKLMWSIETGEEITVQDAIDERAHEDAYTATPPIAPAAISPIDAMRSAMDSLTPAERVLVVEAQQKERMAAITKRLSEMDPASVEAILAGAEAPKVRQTRKAG